MYTAIGTYCSFWMIVFCRGWIGTGQQTVVYKEQ